jgi:threonine/homoserine/homoserine lactone efflux protein
MYRRSKATTETGSKTGRAAGVPPKRLSAGYGAAILTAMTLVAVLASALLPRSAAADTALKLVAPMQDQTIATQIRYTPVERGL